MDEFFGRKIGGVVFAERHIETAFAVVAAKAVVAVPVQVDEKACATKHISCSVELIADSIERGIGVVRRGKKAPTLANKGFRVGCETLVKADNVCIRVRQDVFLETEV